MPNMSQTFLPNFHKALQAGSAVLVRVVKLQGSVPREVGALMGVSIHEVVGTIGGGRLEWEAIAHARDMLGLSSQSAHVKCYPLGPSLGQCCGGVVELAFEPYEQGAAWPQEAMAALHRKQTYALPTPLTALLLKPEPFHVSLFGGGHVGRAIVQQLGNLPCRVCWLDSRDELFPADLPANTRSEHSAPIQAAVHDKAACEPHTHVLIMSFSHAEDLEIVAACLDRQVARGDLSFIGLIGSATKWASFKARLRERGYSEAALSHVTCPIGIPSIGGKEPELIALAVAAQLMGRRQPV
jgi:xanthine dehydrogenase accessory factor